MNISEIITVEHQIAPMELDVSVDQQRKWLSQAARTDLVTAAQDVEAISIFKLVLNSMNHIFIFTLRTRQEEPVGYSILSKDSKYWKVLSIWLQPEFRGKGYITNLYRALTSGGYKLKSGEVVSREAERVWQSLGKAGIAKVLDSKTGKLLPFDDKPIGDGNLQGGLNLDTFG